MSIKIMSAVWESDVAPATRRLVLLALADSANDEGVCWPSLPTIARKAGCGVSTARQACKDLEEEGLLNREYRPVSGKRNQSNIYQIHAEALAARTSPQNLAAVPPRVKRESPQDPAGGPPEIRRGNRNGEPSVEPPVEPSTPPGGDGSADAPGAAPEAPPEITAQQVIESYVDSFRERTGGETPPRRCIAQVGREGKKLLAEGRSPDSVLSAACDLGKTPFATLERQFMMNLTGGSQRGYGGDRDAYGRTRTDATRMSKEAEKYWNKREEEDPDSFSQPIYDDEFYAQQAARGRMF